MRQAMMRLVDFLVILASALIACEAPAPGRFGLGFKWEQQPDHPVWIWVEVRERPDPVATGSACTRTRTRRWTSSWTRTASQRTQRQPQGGGVSSGSMLATPTWAKSKSTTHTQPSASGARVDDQ